MEIFVGTSGWYYSWNLEGTFDWYLKNSGLNAIELNASFYRFPFPNQVKSWANKGRNLHWVVKVNRAITHIFRLNEKAFARWQKFKNLFSPLDDFIDFYLFQMPPNFSPKLLSRVFEFFEKTGLNGRFAFEPRHIDFWHENVISEIIEKGIIFVSVDAPDLPRTIINCSGVIYLRIHGRTAWYSHYYSDEELKEIAEKILQQSPEKVYVFFNNDHAMLENAQRLWEILKG